MEDDPIPYATKVMIWLILSAIGWVVILGLYALTIWVTRSIG